MAFIKSNIYYLLFVALLLEGPITAFVGGGYASQGKISVILLLLLAIVADVIGDVCIYSCGRFFNNRKYIDKYSPIKKVKNYINEKRFFQKLLSDFPFFFFLIVKITPYISTPSLFFAGIKKYHFGKFGFFSVLISCIVKIVYISLGYLGGISLSKLKLIQEGWSEFILFVIIGFILFYLVKIFLKKFSKRLIIWMKELLHKF